MVVYEIELTLPPSSLGGNFRGRTNSKAKRKAVQGYRQECYYRLLTRRIPALLPVVEVSYTFYLCRVPFLSSGRYFPKDDDNAIFSMKTARDVLSEVGIIPDDSADYLRTTGATLLSRKNEHGGKIGVVMRLQAPGLAP